MAEANPLRGFPRIRRAATSIPGNLHLILVLRPTSLLQRTTPCASTDIGFRFSQDDFVLKMPVITLSSVTDLLHYLDENHISSEFDGKLEYCRSDWFVLRTAIESFAVTVKEIAQLLQSFGTELAEIELPDEANAIEYLLTAHTDKYRQMKDEIRSVIKEGRQLQVNLETSKPPEGNAAEQREADQDRSTVQRLLAQLRDMEMAFDEFFEKHHLKLQQYLQLLRYEQGFHEMELTLEQLTVQEKAIPSVGMTVGQTEQLLADLEVLDARAEEEMTRAQIIILHGHQMATSHHYALALIVQRCNELRHHCDVLTTSLRARRASLTRARDLLICLEEVTSWCDEGAYLLANQLVDKFQSKEGAQMALLDLDRLLERGPSVLRSSPDVLSLEFQAILTPQLESQITATAEKLSAVRGMIQNRQACLRKLADLQARPIQLVAPRPENPPRCCKSPLFSPKHSVDFNSTLKFSFSDLSLPGKRGSRKSPSTKKIEVMHDYEENRSSMSYTPEGEENPLQKIRHVIKELIDTERVFVEELLSVLLGYRAEMDNPALSGLLPAALRNKKDVLFGNMSEIYNFHSRIFLQDLESCLEVPERVGACFLERTENFKVYERYCQNKPRSESLWRQCSDSAFFQELLKHSANSDHASELQGALNAMLDLLKSVNDSMHQIAITGYEGDLSDLGRVLMQGSFNVWISHKKGSTRMKDLARFKPMQRHLFLHEHALLFCKKREENGEGNERTSSYSFKHCLRMSAVGITENIKGDIKKFELWYSGREEVYLIQAPSVEVKMSWLTEIRKILTNQRLAQDEGHTCVVAEGVVDSLARVSVCMPWSPTQITGCSACFDVPPHSKLQGASVSSEETESGRTSPVLTDPVIFSPRRQQNRRSWHGTSNSADFCEGLEDWTTDLSNLSESDEEEEATLLVPGRYRAVVDGHQREPEDLVIKCGDVLQLVEEDGAGLWLVRNITRGEEGRVPSDSLVRILGETGYFTRQGDMVSIKTRKLSS
ncbi:hypothetical protein AALO_G00029130 [Alosa alosa]|uniref:MCF.2 cell line derived transforming sequence b n=1 Tax=Alosa alosa TaxID=278164 RepID=A0AAV6HBB3_9TELE|nr:proto-oncogene DBL isoform X1 [Alosa alosa]KAG5284663.1 hypothetical protein AALO_G00029130 [Alosa alosa]